MYIVFTDLDGTLLDRDTYSYDEAGPALALLARRGIPLVFTTSKTRAETEDLRVRLDNQHPFIVENGGAVFVPAGYFPFPVSGSRRSNGYDVIEFGDRYEDLVEGLRRASRESGCRVRGFSQMTVDEVSHLCSMPSEEAVLAVQREYDEPFEVLDPALADALVRAIESQGRRCTRGGRFYHITGGNDKAGAVLKLRELYLQVYSQLTTVGLGDGLNDAEFLNVVDIPVLVRSASLRELQAKVPQGRLTDSPGPRGWNAVLLEMIPE